MRKFLLLCGILLSSGLVWFAVSNYLSARPLAEENLHGSALSLAAAIQNIALHDPSLRHLDSFKTQDIAFFALIDRYGLYRFHTNPDLIGSAVQGALPLRTLQEGVTSNERVTLRTGEIAFEFNAPLNLPGEVLALRLTLHTYRADSVVRRAELTMMVMVGLLVSGWLLAFALYRFIRREEQLQLAMARRESLAHLGEMGAMLAHEIRNPLSGIKGFAQVIEKKPMDERNSGFARSIVAETHRLETLVNDLLTYARTDQDAKSSIDLCEIVAYIAALLRHEAEQSQVEIVSECHEGMLVTGNRDRLGQVLLNLGKNAIQSMPDGGKVHIEAGLIDRRATVRVCDEGNGISKEDLARIFEPFYTTKARGTGLGLALCKKIVEEHNGKITVQSVVGEGTSVTITIPLRQNDLLRS